MKKKVFFLTLLLSQIINSQIVNSNEKTIGDFYNADVNRLKLDGGKVELQLKLSEKPTQWVINDKKSKKRSATKVRMFYLDVGLTNTKSFLNVNDFDFNSVGFKTGLTFQESFNKIYVDDSINKKLRVNKLTTWTLSGEIKLDRFKNFDPNKNEVNNELPTSINFNGGINFYFFNTSLFRIGTVIPNFNLRLTPLGYNSSNLQNYILSSNTNNNGQVIFTDNKSFDGKYGVLENNTQASFLAFSSPFVFDKKIFNLFYLAPTPHISWQTSSDGKPKYNGGFALGFLNKPVKGEIKTEDEKGKTYTYHKFNAPSFLSFGVDWDYQNNIGSKPKYYISGTFNLN